MGLSTRTAGSSSQARSLLKERGGSLRGGARPPAEETIAHTDIQRDLRDSGGPEYAIDGRRRSPAQIFSVTFGVGPVLQVPADRPVCLLRCRAASAPIRDGTGRGAERPGTAGCMRRASAPTARARSGSSLYAGEPGRGRRHGGAPSARAGPGGHEAGRNTQPWSGPADSITAGSSNPPAIFHPRSSRLTMGERRTVMRGEHSRNHVSGKVGEVHIRWTTIYHKLAYNSRFKT